MEVRFRDPPIETNFVNFRNFRMKNSIVPTEFKTELDPSRSGPIETRFREVKLISLVASSYFFFREHAKALCVFSLKYKATSLIQEWALQPKSTACNLRQLRRTS